MNTYPDTGTAHDEDLMVHAPTEARQPDRDRGLIIARVIHHIGGGIRWSYNRNLGYAFAISLGVHVAIIGLYLLTRIGEEEPVARVIPTLVPLTLDTTALVLMDMSKVNVITPGGGGGDPLSDKPIGKAKAGDPNATPMYVKERKPSTEKPKVFEPKTPTKIRAVENPKTDKRPLATTDRDTAKGPSSGTGLKGQHAEGTGTSDAGGSGGKGVGTGVGIGVGSGSGLGSRGWVRAPRGGRSSSLEASGQVVPQATVMPNGDVTNIRPIKKAHASLVADATRRLSSAKARPLPEDAEQKAVTVQIPFTYNLE